jgi:hypothetical protein
VAAATSQATTTTSLPTSNQLRECGFESLRRRAEKLEVVTFGILE